MPDEESQAGIHLYQDKEEAIYALVIDNQQQREIFKLGPLIKNFSNESWAKLSELFGGDNSTSVVSLDYNLVDFILAQCQLIKPRNIRAELKELLDSRISLDEDLDFLFKGDCIEASAGGINEIICRHEKDPASALNWRLTLTVDEEELLIRRYRALSIAGLDTKVEETTIQLPSEFVKANFKSIATLEEDSWFLLLLELPIEHYADFFEAVAFPDSQITFRTLSQRIRQDGFLPTQVNAVFKALIQHNELWSELQDLLHLAVQISAEATELVLAAFNNDHARLKAIESKDGSGNTVLRKAVGNPESLKVLLNLYPDNQNKLAAIGFINYRGNAVLHSAAGNPESLRILLNLYPDNQAKLSAIKVRNNQAHTVLHLAAGNPDSLKFLLNLYPDNQSKLAAIGSKNHWGSTVLHCAIYKGTPESIKVIVDSLSGDEAKLDALDPAIDEGYTYLDYLATLPASTQANDDDNTILDLAIDNPRLLRVILDSLSSDQAKLTAVRFKTKYGSTVLQSASDTPESLKVILNSLSNDKAKLYAAHLNCNIFLLLDENLKEQFELEGKKILLLLIKHFCEFNWSTYYKTGEFSKIQKINREKCGGLLS